MNEPLLSVCLITYNHAKYIKEAIEGVLMQKLNFSYELIIADDFSTDGTRDIVREYAHKYPELIKLILQEKNVGPAKNWKDLIIYPKSKYIAYFEGDDYWIDPYKLQKQIDFLEANEKYSLCFHNAKIVNFADGSNKLFRSSSKKIYFTKDVIINKWFCPSASILFRRSAINHQTLFNNNIKNGDLLLLFIVSLYGPLYYIDEVMSVYHYGIQNSLSDRTKSKGLLVLYKNIFNYLSYINKITHNKFFIYILIKRIYIFLAILKNIVLKKNNSNII